MVFDIKKCLLGDFHTHSNFSNDAQSSLQENILAAKQQNLNSLCINDHVRQDTTWVNNFLAALKKTYQPPGLQIYSGVETKLLDTKGNLDLPKQLKHNPKLVDRIIVGDHQFPSKNGPILPTEIKKMLLEKKLHTQNVIEMYLEASCAVMEKHHNLQLGHWFSLFPKIGILESQIPQPQLKLWAETAKKTGTVIEINEKWACPTATTIKAALTAKTQIVFGTDSHSCENIGKYKNVKNIIKEAQEN